MGGRNEKKNKKEFLKIGISEIFQFTEYYKTEFLSECTSYNILYFQEIINFTNNP